MITPLKTDTKQRCARLAQKPLLFLAMSAFLLTWLMTPAVAAAEEYYVSPDGDDRHSGSSSEPWRTVEKAAETAKAGDTVYFMDGTYRGQLRPKHSGTAGNPIVFTAYPGATATIDGGETSRGSFGGIVDIQDKSHITVSNLRIVNGGYFGIRVSESDNILILGNQIDFTFSSGIYLSDSQQVIVDGNDVQRACHGVGGAPPQEHITVRNGMDGFEIRNNRVHVLHDGMGKEGINIKEGSANGKVYNNVVEGMKRTGLYVDAYDAYIKNIEIYGNLVTDSLHGIVVASERGGTIDNISIHNNVFHNNQHSGVWVTHYLQGGQMDNIEIVNNTIYNNAEFGVSITNPESSGVLVRNNILLSNNDYDLYIRTGVSSVVADHNFTEGDANFVDASSGNFRLQPYSSAVDAGSGNSAPAFDFDGNRRPHGQSHDLGAYELVDNSTLSPAQFELFLPLLNH